jgi:hypothetical protein
MKHFWTEWIYVLLVQWDEIHMCPGDEIKKKKPQQNEEVLLMNGVSWSDEHHLFVVIWYNMFNYVSFTIISS